VKVTFYLWVIYLFHARILPSWQDSSIIVCAAVGVPRNQQSEFLGGLQGGGMEVKMSKILVVVDMQNDFIDGALGTAEAQAIVPYVKQVIENFEGKVYFTRDTHFENYMETQEGKNLPVPHCIKGTEGWQIRSELDALRKTEAVDKLTFGSKELVEVLAAEDELEGVTFVGLCTDICVISNAMVVKAFFPELPLTVDAKACAGVTPESHKRALEAMKVCQIKVINE
jgi:nicotinamidase-related amidase